ncbi:TPA: diguanylate cyclase [Vibrio fluvialis]|nr:diguanylate cyclase [Vibrio fluvialis]
MNSVFYSVISANPDLLHVVFEALPEPTFLINREGIYVEAWGGTDTQRHHNPATIIGMNQQQVLPADKAIWFNRVIGEALKTGLAAELEYELDPKQMPCFEDVEGPQDLQFFNALVIPLPNTEFVLWIVRNVTEYLRTVDKLARHQLELEHLTHIDHLTQVYNRYAMDSLLPQALDVAKLDQLSCALFMIDIDCFKEYNDFYGHLQGDEALKQVSQALNHWKRKGDLCFRYGGDEFLLFIPDISVEQCEHKAHQLLSEIQTLAIPHHNSHVNDALSVTIGIHHCLRLSADMTAEKLVAIADKALFHAKHQRRGTMHIY